ncbi:MAG: hypothetical protein IT452_15235 [Planctomycetia bacterium]|nr:hypothetical protein [Planctomycetia bacterium]
MSLRGLGVEIAWVDEDVVELRITGSNGLFGGQTQVYADRAGFAKLAAFAKGFPQNPDERRLIELGTFDPGFAGGGARLGLRVLDGAGHVALDVLLATQVEDNRHQRVEFFLEVEPAALDDFARRLDTFALRKGETASLPALRP